MKILVTGGAGFIGSCFVKQVLSQGEHQVTVLDALTYAGSLQNLGEEVLSHPGFRFVKGDLAEDGTLSRLLQQNSFDCIVNFAAESHVDRSIQNAGEFIRTNVHGVYLLLEAMRRHSKASLVQISTDEVYGSLGPTGTSSEEDVLHPSNPYAASKAAADHLCLSYLTTYGLPVLITRSSNAYGPFQHPEKLIPTLIQSAATGGPLPLYGDGLHVRTWTHVEDVCEGIWRVTKEGQVGRIYHISSGEECTNLEMANEILRLTGNADARVSFVADRPGHDRRYAVNCQRIQSELAWSPKKRLAEGLRETVQWYQQHAAWVEARRLQQGK